MNIRRYFPSRKNHMVALGLVVAMVLWIGCGLLVKKLRSSELAVVSIEEATSVVAKYSYAEPFTRQLKALGRSEANRKVQVKAQIGGLVTDVAVAEGSFVETGDVICELAFEDRQLRFDEALADKEKAHMDYKGAMRLQTEGYQSRTAIASAKADLERATAVLHRRELDLNNLKIRAPFAGIVDVRQAEVGDLIERGDICATLLELNPLLISAEVSETDVGLLTLGAEARVVLLTGQESLGELSFIGRDSSPSTRAFRIEVSVDNSEGKLHSGMTADIFLSAGTSRAHRVSPALLLLDDSGALGLRVLDASNRVAFNRVDVVGGDASGVWVQGLPEKALIIRVGQHFVSEGEVVAVSIEDSPAESVGRRASPIKEPFEFNVRHKSVAL